MMTADPSLDKKSCKYGFRLILIWGIHFWCQKWKKNDILLLFYSLKSGSSCQYIGTEQLRDTDRLLSFIFEMRETGMAVSVNSIVLKALQLSREFREKSMIARHSAIHQFINVHGFVHRMGTHLLQHQPSEMEEIATGFVRVTREKLQMSCRDEDYIINMDQTPIPFSYDPKKTIEVVGQRTIHIRKTTCDMKRASCALTVTASGKMITPLFVFKGNN